MSVVAIYPPARPALAIRPFARPAFAIPEILLAIADFLSPTFLARCAVVCKSWNDIFQPLLFRSIFATDFYHPAFDDAFQNNTYFVTSIECFEELPPSLSSSSSSSPSSTRPFTMLIRKPFEQLEGCLLAGQTPSLKSLFVLVENQDPNRVLRLAASTVVNLRINTGGFLSKRARLYIEDILQSYPNLVHLTLEGRFTLGSRLFEERMFGTSQHLSPATILTAVATTTTPELIILSPSSTSSSVLQISSPSSSSSSSSSSTGHSTIVNKGKVVDCSSSIESLHLHLVVISQEELLALSVWLPQLKSLLLEESIARDKMVKTYRWKWSSAFVESLGTAFPHLQSLRFEFLFESIEEDTIIKILESFPQLITVGFRNAHFGKRAMETLREHCKFVECLDVSFACGNHEFRTQFKAELLRSLQKWSCLRELVVDDVIFYLDAPIDAGVMRAPWACIKLEKLVCGFHGSESTIFQFLSQFPTLLHLKITEPSFIISSIDTTLAWMSRSTKIEYFSFKQHEQVLKQETIQWLLDHLPNLKRLHVAGPVSEHQVGQWRRDTQRLGVVLQTDKH